MFWSREASRQLDKLEVKYDSLKEDFSDLRQFVQDHMKQEEKDRDELNRRMFWMGIAIVVIGVQVTTGMPLIPALIGLIS